MKRSLQPITFTFLLFTFLACKKNTDDTSGNPNNPGGGDQGPYSGAKLVVAKSLKVASPWVELNTDTVYCSYNLGSGLIKPIPTGFEDKIISFYLPKGYMVVFASNYDGTGESACFVASQSAIKANLPSRLRNNISYIRCLRINDPEKKGTCSTSDPAVQAVGSQWHYTWGWNKSSFPGQQFVPMTWGKSANIDANAKYLIERNDVDHLLSFNEPDNPSQSNIPVDTAIERYKIMQKTGLRLGSPVVRQDEAITAGKWLPTFMERAQALRLRVDYISVHWYDWGNENNNAATDSLTGVAAFNRFVTYINRIRTAYPTHPIWVTEFNANVNRSSQTVQRVFMRHSTEWMNNQPFIERYSFFFENNYPILRPDNTLTELGAFWRSLTSSKSFTSNIVLDASLVN
jgi:hypothetical protein